MPSAGCFLNWIHLVVLKKIIPQLIFSVPLVLLYSAYWVFPESSRWLLANGRVEEAEDIVREIARCGMFWNKCLIISIRFLNVSQGQMVEFYRPSGDSCRLLRAAAAKVSTLKKSRRIDIFDNNFFAEGGSATSFFRLFTLPNMRRKTFICYYLWFR